MLLDEAKCDHAFGHQVLYTRKDLMLAGLRRGSLIQVMNFGVADITGTELVGFNVAYTFLPVDEVCWKIFVGF